jgi:hypothetical protein
MRWLLVACALHAGCVEVLGASEPVLGGTPVSIQQIMGPTSDPDHVAIGTTVALTGVYVTASSPGRSLVYVQAPAGSTSGGHPYPEFSATRVFFPVLNAEFPSEGDCIDVEGTVTLFLQALQVTGTSFAKVDAAACGEPPRALSIPSTNPPVTFADLQTRSTTTTNDPGPKTGPYIDVLLSFQNVKIMTLPDPTKNDGFFFAPQSATSGPLVLVSNFLVGPPALQVGQSFRSITGVYPTVDGLRIFNPRTAADYAP